MGIYSPYTQCLGFRLQISPQSKRDTSLTSPVDWLLDYRDTFLNSVIQLIIIEYGEAESNESAETEKNVSSLHFASILKKINNDWGQDETGAATVVLLCPEMSWFTMSYSPNTGNFRTLSSNRRLAVVARLL